MKESVKTSSLVLEVLNPSTGEKFLTKGSSKESHKYYSIKKLTSRVNSMDLLNILSKVCKSPKDLDIINELLEEADFEGRIVITNISNKAKQLNIARSKLNNILSNAIKTNFFFKLDTGVYFVNPFIFIGKRVRSNEQREFLQKEWKRVNKS